ncbi:IclR family transcriptional regulator [Buttiauxella gaviniae]|uniref:IclR family transcriptional regulator n=1 Tax=Enterobacterales TaxID=91347 RepID=UPI0039AF55D0
MSEQVKSLAKAMSVIEYLGRHPNGMALQDIAIATGINKTSVHRMLCTFETLGYVSQVQKNKNYKLTLMFLNIGHSALDSDVISITRPMLNALMEEFNETVNFISREGDQIVFRDKLEPKNSSFRTRTFIGLYSDMYCSAAGKCFLAYASAEEQENYWGRNEFSIKKFTEHTITTKAEFMKELELVRVQGFALDNEENEIGISCTAVPIFDKSGTPAYVISISTLTPKLRALVPENLAEKIKVTTALIEESLF